MPDRPFSRREWLSATGGLAALGLVARNGWALPTSPRLAPYVPAPDPATPDEALRLLAEGNARFAAGRPEAPHRDLARLRDTAAGQRPFAAVLGCADSRVPVELVFDQGFGDLFVTRVAGNVASSEAIASLEFGCAVLGCKALLVLGHTSCGAVNAALQGGPVPGQISTLYRLMRPAVRAAGGDPGRAVVANVRDQALTLAEASPVLADLVRRGSLKITGGVYDLATGRVTPVEV